MEHEWLPLKLKQREFTPEILQEIGSIVICWADLEDAFDSDLDWLSKYPDVSALLPDERPISFKKRLDLWRKAARTALKDYPDFHARILEVSRKSKNLSEWRNALNHGHLKMKDGECILWTKKYVGHDLTRGEYAFPTTALKQLAANIRNLTSEVHAFNVNRLLGTHRLKAGES